MGIRLDSTVNAQYPDLNMSSNELEGVTLPVTSKSFYTTHVRGDHGAPLHLPLAVSQVILLPTDSGIYRSIPVEDKPESAGNKVKFWWCKKRDSVPV